MTMGEIPSARAPDEPDHLPLSPAQRSIWFLDKAGDGGSYHIARARRLRGPLDLALLREAHEFVLGRHETLRTRYVDIDGVPAQVVDPPGEADFEIVAVESNVASYLEWEAERAFDLSSGPMWRTRVIPVGPDEHLLLDVVHHIAADGWSLPLMRFEVGAHYNAAVGGSILDLPPALQYRELMGDDVKDRAIDLAYWENTLSDAPEVLSHPVVPDGLSRRRSGGFWLRAVIPGVDTANLDRLAGELEATPSMIGLSIFAASLARYGRQDDVVIGVPVTDRTRQGEQQVVGPLFNSLPIRLRPSPGASLRELVAQTRRSMLEALDHAAPFDEIVQRVDPPRRPGTTPIFQAMFQQRDAAFQRGYGLVGVTEESMEVAGSSAKFDLLLEVGTNRDEIELSLNASSDFYDRATGSGIIEGIAQLASRAFSDPDRPLGELSTVSPTQESRLMEWLASNDTPLPSGGTLADRYEAAVAGRGAEPALVGQREISHRDLLAAASDIGTHLQNEGVGTGSVVALVMERSPAMVAAILAINRLGGVYVPVDPEYPEQRIGRILETSGAMARLSSGDPTRWSDVKIEPVEGPHTVHDPSLRAVYVMFTSGSTGQPKGVVVSEDAVLRLVCATDYVTIRPGDVVAHVSNVAFDASTFEIWAPLLNGASMAIIERETVLSPVALEMSLSKLSVSTIFVTTALFNLIARQRPGLFSGVRDVLFGGERCDPSAVRKVLEAGPPQRLLHVYGPTETTTFASWYEIPQDRPVPRSVPIGRPIANTTLYVLDAWKRPLPLGLVGELYVGGPGVAIGYTQDVAGTSQRFTPDPFTADPWGMMYRTGDLVRVNDDGFVEFVGRADRQVKLRGFRIEPNEIEHALISHPLVEDALVRLVEDNDRRLVAWAVVDSGAVDGEQLKAHLGSILPSFMIPDSIVPVSQLPIGPTGKIDSSILPEPGPSAASGPPQTNTEARVAQLFSEILEIGDVGRLDDFFDLGGHSIRAVELLALIEKRLGVRLGVVEMMEAPTPAALAERVDRRDPPKLEQRLVTMAEGTGDALIVFHHPSGTVYAYSDLVRALPTGLRVIGVNASGVDGTIHPSEDLAEMAAEYASLLVSAHSEPFQLLGHSLGGLLAWETARQLTAADHTVSFLGLIDTQLPRALSMSRFVGGLPGSISDYSRSGYRRLRRIAGDLRWGSRRLAYQARRRPLPPDLARIGLVRASSKAFDSYRPRPAATNVVYFLASGEGTSEGRMQSGWNVLAPDIDIVPVPGKHSGPDSILAPPNVAILARELASRIPAAATPLPTESDCLWR